MEPSSWFVYILECADGSLYTGITKDPEARLAKHNQGTASRCTRARLPVRLIFCEEHVDRSGASRREAAIKKYSRREKLALIKKTTAKSPVQFSPIDIENQGR